MTKTLALLLILCPDPPDFPLNRESRGSLLINGSEVKISSSVTKDGNTYLYRYAFKNTGKTDVFVQWELIDKVVGVKDCWLLVERGKTEVVEWKHKDAPVEAKGLFSMWTPGVVADGDVAGVKWNADKVWVRSSATQTGPLPKGK